MIGLYPILPIGLLLPRQLGEPPTRQDGFIRPTSALIGARQQRCRLGVVRLGGDDLLQVFRAELTVPFPDEDRGEPDR